MSIQALFMDSFDYIISDAVDTGAEIGGKILGIPGAIVGAVIGGAIGCVHSILDDSEYFVLYFEKSKKIPMKIHSSTNFMDLDISYLDFFEQSTSKKYCIYSPKETIERAKSRIGEEKYNLVSNNCEHFAIWCKSGIAESKQVDRVVRILTQTPTLDMD
jgi:hypothetical protein